MARIGLMLYSVRDECAHDFEGVLRSVAAMGYEGVEIFDLHGHEAAAVRGWLDELGLVAYRPARGAGRDRDQLPELAAESRDVGWRRLALSWLDPATLETPGLAAHIGDLRPPPASRGSSSGSTTTTPSSAPSPPARPSSTSCRPTLWIELDLGWAWYAGVDSAPSSIRARDRCPIVHVKDIASREGKEYRPVGDGAVGYDRLAPAAVAAGVEWLLVEQDEAEGSTIDAAERSFAALAGMLGVAA